jgi:signal transduction histidine kinase/ligand-binding sensor domain-containing protein
MPHDSDHSSFLAAGNFSAAYNCAESALLFTTILCFKKPSLYKALIALLLSARGVCQVGAGESSAPLQNDVLTTWTTAQGLPQNFITSLAQTSDGFLWVGTLNGLVRFDGLHFRGFGQEGPQELQGLISALAPDFGDGLWIVTASNLLHYEQNRFVPIAFEHRAHYRVETLARSNNGELWLYLEGKLERTHADTIEPVALPVGVHRLTDMAEDRDGALWITDRENIFRVHDGAVAKYSAPGSQLIYADQFGDVWAGDGHHLFRFNGRGFQPVKDPGLGNFVSVTVDSHHRLWMASGGLHGLSRKSGDEKATLTEADGLASNDVRTILEGRNGDVWLATIAGLQRLHPGVFTSYSVPGNLAGTRSPTESIFEQKDGSIWTGTLEGGVVRWKSGHWQRYGKAQGLSPGQVRGFFEHGAIPAIPIADYGIFEWRGGRFTKMPSIPQGYVTTPVIASDGSLWFRIENQGLYRLKNGQLAQFGTQDGLTGDQLWSLGTDPQGQPWVGDATGLQRWDGQRFERVVAVSAPVLSAAWPKDGIAVGTLNGLWLQAGSGGSGRLLTQNEGLPGNMVLDVLDDFEGNLWVVTARAIARMSREQWTAYAEGHTDRVDEEIFTEADGLKSRNVLPLNEVTATRADDGRLWFATVSGPAVVDPHLPTARPAQAVIDGIIVDDQHHLPGDFAVSPGRHRITFTYTSPATTAPEQTRFRYRLEGWDRDWVDAGASREVSYTGLPPGIYTFDVIATNREGGSSKLPAQARLKIEPFFWQTKWFLILTACVVIGAIIEITRRFTRRRAERLSLRFQERVAERERIAHQIHDTIIQDLIGATLQLELVEFEVTDHPEASRQSLKSLAARMRETIVRSRNMVSNLHSTAVAQYSLVEVLRHAEAEFRTDPTPIFDLVCKGEPRQVHPLIRDEVYRICREALANAFRHSNAEYVTVEVRFVPDLLEVEISDDGQGMTEEILKHGRTGHFGLRGMQAHANRIGATLSIESEPGEGTHVILRVETRKQSWWHKDKKQLQET